MQRRPFAVRFTVGITAALVLFAGCRDQVVASLLRPRLQVAQGAAQGFGELGDSGADEYRADDNRGGAYSASTFNWLELLVRQRGMNFGAWGTRSEPRRTGYEYNWARSGATSADVISQGQADGLAAQVAAGQVSYVLLMVGINDFDDWNGTYAEVYDGSLSGQALTDKINGIVASQTLAVAKVQVAGAATVFVATVGDRSLTPAIQAAFPDPARRQRVTDAILAVNDGLRAMVLARGATLVDVFNFGSSVLSRVDASGVLYVGGEPISLAQIGDEPHHVMLGDNEHTGTVIQGMLANLIISAFNAADIAVTPFSESELLNNAGISTDKTAPSVRLTSPVDGTIVSGSVSVVADASDNLAVVGVQFRLDGTNLGPENTVVPYSQSWTTTSLPNGPHTLTAVARDAAGNTTTAAAVTVTVNNVDATPPTVSLTAPANGSVIVGAMTVSASASDNVGVAGVTFLRNGVAIGPEDTTAPYTITVQTDYTQNGSSTIVARARDAAGNQRSSSARTVTINNPVPDAVPPTVTITNPAGGSTVSGVVTVAATAADNIGVAGVRFTLDGASLGAEDTVTPFTVEWNTATTLNGTHTLVATARDAVGNTTAATLSVTVSNVTPQLFNPSSYTITQGTYQSGAIGSVVSDDNNYLAVRSATSGWTASAKTEYEFQGVSSTAARLDFTVVAKTSASSTTLRVYALQVTTGSWTQLGSATIGTAESTKTVSIAAGAGAYRDATGRVRLRVEGSGLFSSFTLSQDLVKLTVN